MPKPCNITRGRPLRIAQIHTADRGGGAEQIALELHRGFLEAGHDARLWVGRKETDTPRVYEIDRRQRFKGEMRLRMWCQNRFGLQNFCSPGSLHLHRQIGDIDILAIHSIHGSKGYLNIEALPSLCRAQPSFLVLHDQWTLTGHCSYGLSCERWKHGCGKCPDLSLSPSIKRDGTRLNWLRKCLAYGRSSFSVIPTAGWIRACAQSSRLYENKTIFPAILNSADPAVFYPGDKAEERSALGIPVDAPVVLFLANQGAHATYKDFLTLTAAFQKLKKALPSCILITVGGEPTHETRNALPGDVRFFPYIRNRKEVASYYRAADVFCHATKADVCPLTVIEAQACGVPVVASAVGGIPEILKHEETGQLVPSGDPTAMSAALLRVLTNDGLRRRMAVEAESFAARNFSPTKRLSAYLSLFTYAAQAGEKGNDEKR